MEFVAVFCGYRTGFGDRFLGAARELGAELAGRGIGLVYGGGAEGMMGAVADSALDHGARVIGVIPEFMDERGEGYERLEHLERVSSLHARKARMAQLADAFIALPGGFGTLEELLEILTWSQLGLHHKPVGVVNADGYFDGLLDFLDHGMRHGFIGREDRRRLMADRSPAGLLRQFRQQLVTRDIGSGSP